MCSKSVHLHVQKAPCFEYYLANVVMLVYNPGPVVALVDQETLPIGMLCIPILNAVRRPNVHIRMQDIVEVSYCVT